MIWSFFTADWFLYNFKIVYTGTVCKLFSDCWFDRRGWYKLVYALFSSPGLQYSSEFLLTFKGCCKWGINDWYWFRKTSVGSRILSDETFELSLLNICIDNQLKSGISSSSISASSWPFPLDVAMLGLIWASLSTSVPLFIFINWFRPDFLFICALWYFLPTWKEAILQLRMRKKPTPHDI